MATQPGGGDLYVPKFDDAEVDSARVWAVMRLAISRPHAVWCTACTTWFKYTERSMPSLVRHCNTRHFFGPDGSILSVRKHKPPAKQPATQATQTAPAAQTTTAAQPPPVSNGTAKNVSANAPATIKQQPVADASTTVPKQDPTPPSAPPQTAAASTATPTASATAPPPVATQSTAAAPATPDQKPPPALAKVRKPAAAPAAAPAASPATKPKGNSALLASQNSAVLVRKRGYRVVSIPPAVETVATRAQELLFITTGLLFHDVAFQVPRSEDEALAVIRGAVADLDRSSQNGKLFYLSWAHSQFFQAEMAAIGYKFVTARVRHAGPAAKPPPVGTWLTLRLLTKAAAAAMLRKRKNRGVPEGQPSAQRRKIMADDSGNGAEAQDDAQMTVPAAGTPTATPVAAPAAPPAKPPVAPPAKPPVAPSVKPPVKPLVKPPVAPPAKPPAAPPAKPRTATSVKTSIAPPVAKPIPTPVATPIAPPVVKPIAPPVTRPIAPPVATPIAHPVVAPIARPITTTIAPPAASKTAPAPPVAPPAKRDVKRSPQPVRASKRASQPPRAAKQSPKSAQRKRIIDTIDLT